MHYKPVVNDANPVVLIVGNTVLMDGVEACLRELQKTRRELYINVYRAVERYAPPAGPQRARRERGGK